MVIKQYPYLVTISCKQTRYVSQSELSKILKDLIRTVRKAEWSDSVTYELGKRNTLHLHTIMTRRSHFQGVYLTKLNKRWPTFYIHFQELDIHTIDVVSNYIHKQAYNKYEQEQILDTNYYYWNYAFIDEVEPPLADQGGPRGVVSDIPSTGNQAKPLPIINAKSVKKAPTNGPVHRSEPEINRFRVSFD